MAPSNHIPLHSLPELFGEARVPSFLWWNFHGVGGDKLGEVLEKSRYGLRGGFMAGHVVWR